MKNHTIPRTKPTGLNQPLPRPPAATAPRHEPQPDPLDEEIAHRRLYTDFLALAMYPGMRFPIRHTKDHPIRDRVSAA